MRKMSFIGEVRLTLGKLYILVFGRNMILMQLIQKIQTHLYEKKDTKNH